MRKLSFNHFKKWVSETRKSQRRSTIMAIAMITPAIKALAQGAGAFQQATTEILTYQEPVQKLIYAIAAVVVLVGCFNIFHKMNNGDQDVKKTIMLTIGGCVALVALAKTLPLFFSI